MGSRPATAPGTTASSMMMPSSSGRPPRLSMTEVMHGPAGMVGIRGAVPGTDGPHRPTRPEGEAEHVAVAAEALPEPVRQGEAVAPGLEQQSGGAERPRRQHHHVGGDGQGWGVEMVPAASQGLGPHHPPRVVGRLRPPLGSWAPPPPTARRSR